MSVPRTHIKMNWTRYLVILYTRTCSRGDTLSLRFEVRACNTYKSVQCSCDHMIQNWRGEQLMALTVVANVSH